MWKSHFLSFLALAFLALFLPQVGSAQCITAPVPNPAIRVVSSGASGGYHYIIRSFNNENNWNDIDNNIIDGNDTETPFFPVGWYITNQSNLSTIRSSGATIVLSYWEKICTRYQQPYNYNGYATALNLYLAELGALGLKAVIDIQPFHMSIDQKTSPGMDIASFTLNNARALASSLKGNPHLFAWYLADEPDQQKGATPNALQQVSTAFRQCDATHPLMVVPLTANSLFPFSNAIYDIFAPDSYPFNTWYSYTENTSYDYSITSYKARTAVQFIQNSTKPDASKFGVIMVPQAQDRTPGVRDVSTTELLYQSIAPLIQGTQGVLYWWDEPVNWSSNQLINNNNTIITFLTRKDNNKNTSIADVIMKGLNRTPQTHLSNILIDNNNTFNIRGSNVTINNEIDLQTHYTYKRFNLSDNRGNVYKLNSIGTQWNTTSFSGGNVTSGRVLELQNWNNQIFASIENSHKLYKSATGTAWTEIPNIGSPIRAFSVSPIHGLITAVQGDNSSLHSYNTTTNSWQSISNIIAFVGTTATRPTLITSMLCTNNTILIGAASHGPTQGIYRSTNNGSTWTLIRNIRFEGIPEEIWSLAMNPSGTIMYAGCSGRMMQSTNQGATWTIANMWEENAPNRLPNFAVWSIRCITNTTMYAGTGNGLYWSQDGGVNWSKIPGMPDGNNVWDLTDNSTYVYAATDNGIYRVTIGSNPTATLYNGASGDLRTTYNTNGHRLECRSIINSNGNILVGTHEYPNSFANTIDRRNAIEPYGHFPSGTDLPLFNYTVKKHEGSYYIFAVNDFRPTVEATFVLDQVLDPNETVYRVSELNIDGTETQLNTGGSVTEGLPQGLTKASFRASFGAYQARVFRLDVIKWSNITAISRECSTVEPNFNPCATHAGGVTIADFDGDGKKDDFLVMWVPEMTGTRTEPFRFKIGWNITQNGGNINFNMTPSTVQTNFNGACFGELAGFAADVNSGDVTHTNLGGWNYPTTSGSVPDVLFMGVDPVTASYRTRFLWDVHSSIDQQPVSRLDYTPFNNNFPPNTGWGRFAMPAPTNATGSGIAPYFKTESAPNNTRPEILFMHLPDDPQANFYRYTTSRNWYLNNPMSTWDPIQHTVPTPADARSTQPRFLTPGWSTTGAAMAIGNLYPAASGQTDKYKELVFAGLESSSQEIRLIIDNLDPTTGESDNTWRPALAIPIRPASNIMLKDAGVSLGDIDGDGDDDLIIMAISQNCSDAGTPSPIYVRFGINTLINNPSSFRKETAVDGIQELPIQQPTPGMPVATTLGNHPNPFNTGTVVSYSIDRAAHVEVEIYSMLGTVVLRTDVGVQQAGSYNLPFQAGSLPNGIYMCRLKVDGTVVNSTKMILAR